MNKTGNKKCKVEKEDCDKLDNNSREKLKQRKKKKGKERDIGKEQKRRNRKKDENVMKTKTKIVTKLTQAREQGCAIKSHRHIQT